MELKDVLKALRKRKNLTQKQLAEKAGLAVGTIQQYEAGKREPTFSAAESLSSALGVPITLFVEPNELKQRIIYFLEAIDNEELKPCFDEVFGSVSILQNKLLIAFDRLNDEGQAVAVARVEELTEIKKYQAEHE